MSARSEGDGDEEFILSGEGGMLGRGDVEEEVVVECEASLAAAIYAASAEGSEIEFII